MIKKCSILLLALLGLFFATSCTTIQKNTAETPKTKIGMVVAIEMNAVLTKYGEANHVDSNRGYTVNIYENNNYNLYVVDAGAGEISASTSTQYLIDTYGVDLILNFGVVGALTEEMKTTELCVIEEVIHYDYDTTGWLNLDRGHYPGKDSAYLKTTESLVEEVKRLNPAIQGVVCASADKFIDQAEDKTNLHVSYFADICEMESAGIVLTCQRNDIPVLCIKAVSDTLTGGGKEFLAELERVSIICMDVVDQLIQDIFS